ncbi:hypothetical protein GQ53DRAFT_335573 [Thozetella sp. PMI_491]|nr:hypothetical protein GQ53DRAFT_335573 [Thozetella sp. PMI_491]
MTSRPPLGVQQRQPQRSMSGSSLSQRPGPQQRSLSSQYLPSSPVRKESPIHDLAAQDTPEVPSSQGRYAAQRRGGSRLKLELSHDGADAFPHPGLVESPNALDSTKAFTPTRSIPQSQSDTPDLGGDLSPHPSIRIDGEGAMPMPIRKRRLWMSCKSRSASPRKEAAPAKKDNRPKVWSVEVPSAAPSYKSTIAGKSEPPAKASYGIGSSKSTHDPSVGFCDFFPWRGDHLEDQFNESVIRQGYWDKLANTQTETTSAKGALFPALKHKSGLHALSTVFTGVVGQRRHTGQVTAPWTFKPPPRVTVTDTKREAWLRDLATSAIPLRKLSRTIPHGVRGKVLLEQCMNKSIPFDRALWLAKCVGINEIRAFKRKGVNPALVMGGEAKWIKDWTISVEQFVESLAQNPGPPDETDLQRKRARLYYGIKLASVLYIQQLLDREHYLEWLISSLESSHQAKLSFWLLIVQIYWRDLLELRKYGRRFVVALLSHFQVLQSHADKDLLGPLTSRLAYLLNTIILHTPENFVAPNTWFKYRDTLRSSLPINDETHHKAFIAINSRNEQLMSSGNKSPPAARHILVRMLDTTLQHPMANELPIQCWGIAKDKRALAKAILEWCTSPYRPGAAKIFVTARVLRHWAGLRLDVTQAIMDFLDADDLRQQPRQMKPLYLLVCELVRSGHFSARQYITWLMARGGIADLDQISSTAPPKFRLLVEIPRASLHDSERKLRDNMLRRAGFGVEDEDAFTEKITNGLQESLKLPDDYHSENAQFSALFKMIRTTTRSIVSHLTAWLHQQLLSRIEEDLEIPFNSARAVLEMADDFSVLGDVLKAILAKPTASVDVLVSCADTINRHLFTFAALGSPRDLFNLLHKKLKALVQEQGPAARPLLASLASLAPRIPGLEELAAQLKHDLALTDRNNPVDACSPVSDNMVTRLQDDDGELHEEIEKLLASGTSLDRMTMDRLFQTIIQRLEECWNKDTWRKQRAYSALLTRLRMFDVQHFDKLMGKWLLYFRNLRNRPSALVIYPFLVAVGCLTIPLILSTHTTEGSSSLGARTAQEHGGGTPAVHLTYQKRAMQEILMLFTQRINASSQLITEEECYRFAILQDQAQREQPKELLTLIRNAIAEYSYTRAQNDTSPLPLDDHQTTQRLLALLRVLVLKDATGVARALAVKSPDARVGEWIECLTTRLLIPNASKDRHVGFDEVLELTNEFTLPFCQVKLSLSLTATDMGSPEATDRQQSHLDLFAKAMDSALAVGNVTWTGMLSTLSPDITTHLKSRAQARFLDAFSWFRSEPLPERAPEHDYQRAENLLSVVETIMRGGTPGRNPQLIPAMIDRLADAWEVLAQPATTTCRRDMLDHWLPLLLTFLTLHMQGFDAGKAGADLRARALIVCAGLMQELEALQGPDIDTVAARAMALRVFDLACLLADSLSDDVRVMCVRALRPLSSDARLRYLFSFSDRARLPGDGFMLCHFDKTEKAEKADKTGAAASTTVRQGPQPGVLLGTPAALWGLDPHPPQAERLHPYHFRRWELLNEPNPAVGENDAAINLALFESRKV